MVLSRRHLVFIALPLILLLLLTACERPLASNENETTERISEEAAADAQPSEGAEDASESGAESAAGTAETGTESADAEVGDSDVGGGTPETAAEEAAAGEQDAEQESTGEESTQEAVADDAAAETVTEAAEEAPAEEAVAADSTASEAAGGETVADTGEAMAAEQASGPRVTTLPATHTVAAGENLYRIGLKYGLSWVVLAAYNHLPNGHYIRVGQVLQIPGGSIPAPIPAPPTPDEQTHVDYIVQWGDTLHIIGGKFGISWVEIAEANGLVNPNLIYAGQVLKIPTAQPNAPSSQTHTVKPGDTLYRISLQYGVHWLAIAQANHIWPPYVIYPGQVLALPGG